MDDKVKLNKTQARQGLRGIHVLTILIVALVLLMIGWWAVEMFGEAIAPENPVGGAPAEQPAEAPAGGDVTVE